jgi:hypothetical protein
MSLSKDFRPFKQPMFFVALAAVLLCAAAVSAAIVYGTS